MDTVRRWHCSLVQFDDNPLRGSFNLLLGAFGQMHALVTLVVQLCAVHLLTAVAFHCTRHCCLLGKAALSCGQRLTSLLLNVRSKATGGLASKLRHWFTHGGFMWLDAQTPPCVTRPQAHTTKGLDFPTLPHPFDDSHSTS